MNATASISVAGWTLSLSAQADAAAVWPPQAGTPSETPAPGIADAAQAQAAAPLLRATSQTLLSALPQLLTDLGEVACVGLQAQVEELPSVAHQGAAGKAQQAGAEETTADRQPAAKGFQIATWAGLTGLSSSREIGLSFDVQGREPVRLQMTRTDASDLAAAIVASNHESIGVYVQGGAA